MKYIFLILMLASLCVSAQTFPEEEVVFTNGDITLSGTLSFPEENTGKHKAIILISGSGAQNRDSEILGFKPFRILADFFNKEGYAVLRYDDRGVGRSKGKSVGMSTTEELAGDVRQAFFFLRSRADIDGSRIGLLGHSEGGVVAPMVASKEPGVAFIILAAGFGVKGIELSNAQSAAIQRSNGISEDYIKASGAMNSKIMQMMADTTTTEARLTEFVKTETLKLIPMLPESVKAQLADEEAYANAIAQQVLAQARSPWIRFYMNYDPLPTLKKVKCPVLLLFGELDTQVLASQNSELMQQALTGSGNIAIKAVTIAKANHLFQEAVTGSPAEYATLKKEFTPEFLNVIEEWIRGLK